MDAVFGDVDPWDRTPFHSAQYAGSAANIAHGGLDAIIWQCFEACLENGGISSKNGVKTAPSAFLTVGFRTDGLDPLLRGDSIQ